MAKLTEHQSHILGKMKFDSYYKTTQLKRTLGVDRQYMLDLEKIGLVNRKSKGTFGSNINDPNLEVWYKRRRI